MTGRHYHRRQGGVHHQNGYDNRGGYSRGYRQQPQYQKIPVYSQQWKRDDDESVESQWTPQASSISQPSSPSVSLPSRGPGSLDLDGSTSEISEKSTSSTERRSRSVERCATPREKKFPRAPSLETGLTKRVHSEQQRLNELVDNYLSVLDENEGVIPMTEVEVATLLSTNSVTTPPVRGEDRHRVSWVCTIYQYAQSPPESTRHSGLIAPPTSRKTEEAAKLNPNAQAWSPTDTKGESQSLECWSGYPRKAIQNLLPQRDRYHKMPPPGWSPPTAYRGQYLD